MEICLEVLCSSARNEDNILMVCSSFKLIQPWVCCTYQLLYYLSKCRCSKQTFVCNALYTAWKIQLKIYELYGNITAVCDSIFNNLLHALPEYKDLHPLHSMCHLLLLLGIGGFPVPQPYTHETQKQYTKPFIQHKI